MKNSIKNLLKFVYNYKKYLINEIKWYLLKIYLYFNYNKYNSQESKKILILPAGNLDGGFGEDIMVYSLILNIRERNENIFIDIFSEKVIVRNDYLGDFDNIGYVSGFKLGSYFSFYSILKKYSEIFVFGADVLDGYHSFHNSADRLRILIIANNLNIKCNLISFSINKSINKKLIPLFKQVSKFCKLKVRDIDSFERLNNYFCGNVNIEQSADIAFLGDINKIDFSSEQYSNFKIWINTCKRNNKNIVAICPNAILANKSGLNTHLSLFSKIIDQLIKKNGNFAFVFLYHDLRKQYHGLNDRDITKLLYDKYNSSESCYYAPQIKNGCEIKKYISYVDFTVTARMHFGIAGLTYGKPMFGISYQDKFAGLYKLYNIDIEKSMINYNNFENLANVINDFINNLTVFKQIIFTKNKNIKSLAMKNLDRE